MLSRWCLKEKMTALTHLFDTFPFAPFCSHRVPCRCIFTFTFHSFSEAISPRDMTMPYLVLDNVSPYNLHFFTRHLWCFSVSFSSFTNSPFSCYGVFAYRMPRIFYLCFSLFSRIFFLMKNGLTGLTFYIDNAKLVFLWVALYGFFWGVFIIQDDPWNIRFSGV